MRPWAVVSVAVVAMACVPKSVKESQTALAAQVSVMETRQAVMEKSLQESESSLSQVQDSLRVIGRDKGDLLQALDNANDQMRSLRGEIETLQFQVDDLQQQVDDYTTQQEERQLWDEARLKQIESSLGIKPPEKPRLEEGEGVASIEDPGGEGTGTDGGEAQVELPPTAKGKLDRAIEEMREGRQGLARYVLEQILEQHEGSPITAEVRYRIGETWSNEKDWGRAARAYQVVVDKHDKSDWASWAMLRQGEAFEEMGNEDGARLFYEDLRANYPRSEAAKEAKQRLSEL